MKASEHQLTMQDPKDQNLGFRLASDWPLAGRLKHFVNNWAMYRPSTLIVSFLTGYRVEFLCHPPKLLNVLPKHQSPPALLPHVKEFIDLGCVVPSSLLGFVCPIFVIN